MQRKPRDPRLGIFTRPVVVMLLTGGLWSAMVNITLFVWMLNSGRPLAEVMSMTFVSLVLIQFFKAYNYRSDHLSVFQKPFANKWLNMRRRVGTGAAAGDPVCAIRQRAFATFALSLEDWIIATVMAFSVVPVLETVKWMTRRGWFGDLA